MIDSTKASVTPDQYTDKAGATVKTWALKGLTGWKSVSIRQGDEVEACKVLEFWLSQVKRVAAIRVKLDEAQTNLNRAKSSHEAFLAIYQRYPSELESRKAESEKAVADAEAALAKLVTG